MKRNEYHTEQKETLLEFLKGNSERDFTIDEIIELMSENTPGGVVRPGKSTVYRQIKKLLEGGTVRRFESPEKETFVYQYVDTSDNCNEHFHLKCNKCGKLYHVECSFLDRAKEHILKEHGFLIGSDKAIIYGTCKNCKNSGEEK